MSENLSGDFADQASGGIHFVFATAVFLICSALPATPLAIVGIVVVLARSAGHHRRSDSVEKMAALRWGLVDFAVKPKSAEDQARLSKALTKMLAEDPAFKVSADQESGQTILRGMGELHLSGKVDILRRAYKVDATEGANVRFLAAACRRFASPSGIEALRLKALVSLSTSALPERRLGPSTNHRAVYARFEWSSDSEGAYSVAATPATEPIRPDGRVNSTMRG